MTSTTPSAASALADCLHRADAVAGRINDSTPLAPIRRSSTFAVSCSGIDISCFQQASFVVCASKHGINATASSRHLARYAFWNPNAYDVHMLTVDMDYGNSEERLMSAVSLEMVPCPSFYIVNTRKGTLQASWMISMFPSMFLQTKAPVAWLYHRVLTSLTRHLHGDPCFTDSRRRNPFYHGRSQRVMTIAHIENSNLCDLRDWLEKRHLFDDGRHGKSSRIIIGAAINHCGGMAQDVADDTAVHTIGTRNDAVFRAALTAARNGRDASAAAHGVHCVPMLGEREIMSCVKSAQRYAGRRAPSHSRDGSGRVGGHAPSREVHALLSRWGHNGGVANTAMQQEARNRNLNNGRRLARLGHVHLRDRVFKYLNRNGYAAFRYLAVGGVFRASSIANIARHVGCSRQTVSRCMHEIAQMLRDFGADEFRSYYDRLRSGVAGDSAELALSVYLMMRTDYRHLFRQWGFMSCLLPMIDDDAGACKEMRILC